MRILDPEAAGYLYGAGLFCAGLFFVALAIVRAKRKG